MSWPSFFIGASLVAVCVAVWRAIVASDKRFIEREVRRKKHAHEHIEINADRFQFRGDIAELSLRVQKLEKRCKR